jgi:hypothetical protein
MKNQYHFIKLKSKENIPTGDANTIFFKIQEAIANKPMTRPIQRIDEVGSLLKDGDHFISHNVALRKGKTRTIAGKAFSTRREDLLKLLTESASENDLRPILKRPD